jgi:type IV secretory pathway component VirB8
MNEDANCPSCPLSTNQGYHDMTDQLKEQDTVVLSYALILFGIAALLIILIPKLFPSKKIRKE